MPLEWLAASDFRIDGVFRNPDDHPCPVAFSQLPGTEILLYVVYSNAADMGSLVDSPLGLSFVYE